MAQGMFARGLQLQNSGSDGSRIISARATAIAMVLVSSAFIAAVPSLAKVTYDSGSSVPFFVIGRYSISLVLLGGALLFLKGGFSTTRRTLALCGFAGVAAAGLTFSFLTSITRIDISLALFILYLHPVLIIWVGCARGTYKMTVPRLFYCAMVLFGLGLALSVRFDSLDPLGVGLALLAALGAAVMVVANVDAMSEAGSILVNFYTSVSACVLALIICLVSRELQTPQSNLGWFCLLGAGIAFSLGLVLFLAAVPAIGMVRATLISIVEPFLAIVLAMALFDERLSAMQWAGVVISLAGLALLEVPPGRIGQMFRRQTPAI